MAGHVRSDLAVLLAGPGGTPLRMNPATLCSSLLYMDRDRTVPPWTIKESEQWGS